MLTIKEIIRQLADEGNEKYSKVCTVTSVDGLSCNCSPVDGDADIPDVRLVADETDKFFVLIAKVGSIVVVSFITREAAFISMVSEISEVQVKIGEAYYSVTDEGFLIQKDQDTMKEVLMLIIEAVKQIVVLYGNNPDYAKLQQALDKVNNIFR